VEPHVDTLDQPAGQCHIIVFEQYYLAIEPFLLRNIINILDYILRRFVGRMSFARKYDLDGGVLLVKQLPYPVDVPEDQRRPLISSESSGKAYRKRSRIDCSAGIHCTVGHISGTDPAVYVICHSFLQTDMNFPKFLIR